MHLSESVKKFLMVVVDIYVHLMHVFVGMLLKFSQLFIVLFESGFHLYQWIFNILAVIKSTNDVIDVTDLDIIQPANKSLEGPFEDNSL